MKPPEQVLGQRHVAAAAAMAGGRYFPSPSYLIAPTSVLDGSASGMGAPKLTNASQRLLATDTRAGSWTLLGSWKLVCAPVMIR
jgi:hypothetical protein